LLCGIARTLVAGVRKTDTAARLGGDEFVILLPSCPLLQARRLANELRIAVAAYQLEWEGASYGVGASIGIVAVSGQYANAVAVLHEADMACYDTKRAGRNTVTIAVADTA
jgi:diguanylate cyclase (GGDEF)-like protein